MNPPPAIKPAPKPARSRGSSPGPEHAEEPVPCITVASGGRVLVASDLHLGAVANAATEAASTELARRLERWNGPGAVVLAGDTFELWAEPNNTPAKALRSHPRFTNAVARFAAGEEHSVVVLAGNHDGALGWDPELAAEVNTTLGAAVYHALDIEITTGAAVEQLRIEHGHQLDPHNAFRDPSKPGDRPLGQHVVTDILPGIRSSGGGGWLNDVGALVNPDRFPHFVASRLLYRRMARHLWWLAAPIAAVALLRVALHLLSLVNSGGTAGTSLSRLATAAPYLAVAVIADVVLVAIGLAIAARRAVNALGSITVADKAGHVAGDGDADLNAAARRRAVQLHAEGYRGYVTGHTHQAELVDLAGGFYANSGCNSAVLVERPARAGLPPIFRPARQSGWIELEAGAGLHAEVWLGRCFTEPISLLERLAAKRAVSPPSQPAIAASLAKHSNWPERSRPDNGRRARRFAAASISIAGMLNIASALTPPLRERFSELLRVFSPAAPETASFATAAFGIGLLLLAGGVRRGHQRAWRISLGVLAASAAANVFKGLDVEEALLSIGVAGYLVAHRSAFRAGTHPNSSRRAVRILAAAGAVAVLSSIIVSAVFHVGFVAVATGFAGRVLGLHTAILPGRLGALSAAISATGLSALAGSLWLAMRPRAAAAVDSERDARAWTLVQRHGKGTLDYFALRDDKARYIWGDTVVAYAVRAGVAVVSPDPVGPPDERASAWAAFRRHAADNGWSVAVLGAGEDWLPTYRAAGHNAIYAGDEAVVDIAGFSLDGGRNKTLRQAVTRVARAGYHVEFYDPAHLDADLASQLAAMMGASRRGDVERGFSMTLSRIFDPRDTGLLLAVAFAPDNTVAAFCQYVPAPGINGYSLDLMRRAQGDHPNGLTDFVVIATIEELRQQGSQALALNFATMRAVLAGEGNNSLSRRLQRRALQRFGADMQIESLWRFNAKYDPTWTPRYLIIDGADQVLHAGLAMASAESLWELPFIGRLLRPERSRGQT